MIELYPRCLKKNSRLFTPPPQSPRPLSDITEVGGAILWMEANIPGFNRHKRYTNPFWAEWRGWYNQHKEDYSSQLEPDQDWVTYEEAKAKGKRLFL